MTEIYDKDSIKTIESIEHIRLRPGMYIGKLGDGSSPDDGIYVMLKEIVDNSIDEFTMGEGKTIDVNVSEDGKIQVRDYGRGIPLEKVVAAVSIMNTGAKYDSSVFKKSVGLNGVGSKAVNALSSEFIVESVRDGKMKRAEFTAGKLVREFDITATKERGGTFISFIPDEKLFPKFHFIPEYIEKMLWNYCYLNEGLTINYNDTRLVSKNGIVDLLNNEIDSSPLYPIVHIKDQDFEFAFTHINTQYGEEYFSFVNGQHTTQGGTHQSAFREAFAPTVKEFYKKDYDTQDIRTSLVAAISIKVVEPVFESQTKTKLGSIYMEKDGETVRNYIFNSVKKNLDDYLHIHSDIAEAMLAKIHLSERERKEIADFKKITRERSKKTSLRNEKLRDCRLHYNESYKNEKDEERRLSTTIFITEGNSATGSITKIRDVNTQAVFSLRGKPLNSYGLGKKVVYENEEFNLLQAALNIGEELEGLRYNNIVIATDADVDGMHIRLLLLTFFLQFFPDIVRHGHVYVLQTPLFRVRNKQKTIYCYSEDEKTAALREFVTAANKGSVEITRFKGLGEISPDEFKVFIGAGMRLDPVIMKKDQNVRELLTFYMGKNTPDRQGFIIDNLRIDVD